MNINHASIKASEGSSVFNLGPKVGDYLDVELSAGTCRAKSTIYLYTDGPALLTFFESLTSPSGVKQTRSWSSVEGDLKLSGQSDLLGHLRLRIELANQNTSPSWNVSTTVNIAAAELELILPEIQKCLC